MLESIFPEELESTFMISLIPVRGYKLFMTDSYLGL